MQNHGQRTAFYSCRSVPPQFILAALSVKFNYVVQRPGGRRLARAKFRPIPNVRTRVQVPRRIAHGLQFLHEYEHEYRRGSTRIPPENLKQISNSHRGKQTEIPGVSRN
jgi:hypothetical protein